MRAARVALVFLLVAASVPSPVAAAPAAMQWWGPTEIGQGFHMRVTASVTNAAGAATSAPVALEVDLGQALADAGWNHADAGDRDQIQAFRLDPESVRVVAMTDLGAPSPGTTRGQMKAVDPTYPPGDARRYEVPSSMFPGRLSSDEPFDVALNPVVTVLWRTPEPIAAGATQHFMVYFDSDLSADAKAAADYGGSLAGGDLLGMFWSGPATTLYGYVNPRDGQGGTLHLISLQADTDAQIFTAALGQSFAPLPSGGSIHFASEREAKQVGVAGTTPTLVKVVADKPVFAQTASVGFVPSTDAGMAGKRFVFSLTHPSEWEQDTVYFTSTDPREPDGVLDATTVEVQALWAGGPTYTFQLGTTDNPWGHTVGARSAMSQGECLPSPSDPSPRLPFGPGAYEARVVSGERVLLQYQNVDGLAQVPTVTGAPAGTEHRTALAWSDEEIRGIGGRPTCVVPVRPGAWLAAPSAPSTETRITSPELSHQVDPRSDAPSPPPRVLGSSGLQGPFTLTARDSADRMLRLESSAPMTVFAGNHPPQVGATGNAPYAEAQFGSTVSPSVHGPLGGDAVGREFAVPGEFAVIAPYEGTILQLALGYAGGRETRTVPIATDGHAVFRDRSPTSRLLDTALVSSRPVFVYPLAASGGVLAGVPTFLQATAGAAEYRGFLVDLSSPDGLDPIARSTPPGTPITYDVEVANRGRLAGGEPLEDNVAITATAPEGWTVLLDGTPVRPGERRAFTMAGATVRDMEVTIVPPDWALADTSAIVTLKATSQGNPRMQDTLQLVTFLKTVRDVGIWFGGVGGPKDLESAVRESGSAPFDLVVQNQGSKTERIHIEARFKGGSSLWQARLGAAGVVQMEVDLEPAPAVLALPLSLVAPPGLLDGEATAVVTAFVVDAPAARDAVQATGVLSAPSDIKLEIDAPIRFVDPGQPAVFLATLRNEGQGGTTLRLEAQSGSETGWGKPALTLAGTDQAIQEVALAAGDVVRLQVSVTPETGSPAGLRDTLRFSATTPEGDGVDAVLVAQVKPVHVVTATTPPMPVTVADFDPPLAIPVRITNAGNLDEHLEVRVRDLPPGWTVAPLPEVLVQRGKAQSVDVLVAVPRGTAPGLYDVAVELVSEDGHAVAVSMRLQVLEVATGDVEGPSAVEAVAGQPVSAAFEFHNDGNAMLLLAVVPQPGEAWLLDPPSPMTLPPGANGTLHVTWLVPASARDGMSTHAALLQFSSPEGAAVPPPKILEAAFDVGRPDLVVANVTTVPGPGGALVTATVRNMGDRPARDFEVVLVVDGVAATSSTVGILHPGDSAQVLLLQVQAGKAEIRVDDARQVPEGREDNNGALVPAAVQRDAPAQAIAWALLLLVSCASAWRRRRR